MGSKQRFCTRDARKAAPTQRQRDPMQDMQTLRGGEADSEAREMKGGADSEAREMKETGGGGGR